MVCRTMNQGLEILNSRAASLPSLVILALGTNGGVTDSQVRLALTILGPDRRLVLVTPHHGDTSAAPTIIRAEAAKNRNQVLLLDWDRVSAGHPEWFAPDGTHLGGDAGIRAFASLLDAALPYSIPAPPQQSSPLRQQARRRAEPTQLKSRGPQQTAPARAKARPRRVKRAGNRSPIAHQPPFASLTTGTLTRVEQKPPASWFMIVEIAVIVGIATVFGWVAVRFHRRRHRTVIASSVAPPEASAGAPLPTRNRASAASPSPTTPPGQESSARQPPSDAARAPMRPVRERPVRYPKPLDMTKRRIALLTGGAMAAIVALTHARRR